MTIQVEDTPDFDLAVKAVSDNTIHGLFPLWMGNLAENLQEARFGDSLDKLYERPASERVLIVGRGPSLFKHGHLDLIEKFDGDIVASDGALPLLAEKSIVPYVSMSVDGNEVISKWFGGATASIGGKVKAVLPVTIHPKTAQQVKRIGGHIYWYIPELDQEPIKGLTESIQLMTYTPKNPTGLSRHNGAGNSGMSALVLARSILRTDEICMIGLDGGYPPDTPLADCHYHQGMLKACGYNDKQVLKLYRMYYHPQLGYTVVDPVFQAYRSIFLVLADALVKAGVKVVNASEGGCLFSDGVEVMKFEDYLRDSRR